MKSGLEGRNNQTSAVRPRAESIGRNEVRPRRPEQSESGSGDSWAPPAVSMKSGLEGRNNPTTVFWPDEHYTRLNEVRPRRPEQSHSGLGGFRPCRKVSMKSGLEGRNNPSAGGADPAALRVSQ